MDWGRSPAALRQMEEWTDARPLYVFSVGLCGPAECSRKSRSFTTHVVNANGFVAEIFRFSVCSRKHPIYLTAVLLFFMTADLNELPGAVFKRGSLPLVAVFICALVSLKKSWALKRWDSAQSCHVIFYYFLVRA